jgi:hypothetical protein
MYEAFLSNVAEPIDFFQISLAKYKTMYTVYFDSATFAFLT